MKLLETQSTRLVSKSEIKKAEKNLENLKLQQNNINKIFIDLISAEKVDICFLIDCTSSMSTYIEQVQLSVNNIVEKLKNRLKALELRFALVGYRDHSEGDDRIVNTSFIDDIDTFKLVISSIQAFGGEE